MAINISILGSTGSIGTQTLSVVDEFKNSIKVVGISAGESIDKVREQTRKYHPKAVSVKKEEDAKFFRPKKGLRVGWGDSGNCMVATLPGADKVVIATPGLAGIKPTLAAITAKKTIALATKEVLVAAGDLVTREAKNHNVEIVPIDSEHSAIFQSLGERSIDEVKNVIITASGGPFRGKKPKDLKNIKVEQALAHPNWKMGRKITIDSATLMNKGFEVIEAMWLFGVPLSKIKVVVHPQSVIHSAVEFIDGSIIAQIGPSDMRLPIQFALFYPGKRRVNSFKKFSFGDYPNLSFEEPDIKTFRCLGLAYRVIKEGKTAPAVLTAANDIAVEAFLNGNLPFLRIPDVVESVLDRHAPKRYKTLEEILAVDSWAREEALKFTIKFSK